ncbi:UDP-glucose dehydrogenase family protein [Cohnella terricola]|uniref:UDP-glucose 6-dehydrogenase n=1 Tax=Cohnella terricola TaxID=1289167 RepID=A0A559JIQ6_9BACL|nr:UDP-glucose/GDP-mannose dehydrogenase family protein [Cohnella terricola]TVX99751.1 UDP-glucose/GDP-mannose dehydrogenase family protein [Cohnella terricola]
MNIGVFGAGYVGLVTAVCLSDLGFKVRVVEKDRVKRNKLQEGVSTIYEPGLQEMLVRNLKDGRLIFTDDSPSAIQASEVLFVCVGTPSRPDGSADMSQIEAVTKEIVESSLDSEYKLVVVKSTVPVGTGRWIEKMSALYAKGRKANLEIASNPEFLREGAAVKEFMHPDRIVVGVASERGKSLMEDVYRSFDCPKLFTDSHTAEIIKYAANSFLATKISYINMVSDLCEETGADVALVAEGIGYDKRIGPDFLKAGPGFGGSCFPKDLRAFAHIGKSYGLNFGLLEQVMQINRERSQRMIRKLREQLWVLGGKRIAVLGLAFKPGTDDVRETPAISVIEALLSEGASVLATDPLGIAGFRDLHASLAERISFVQDPEEALRGAHAAVIVTDWEAYRQLDWADIKLRMETPVLLDGRNMLDRNEMRRLGFAFMAVGR